MTDNKQTVNATVQPSLHYDVKLLFPVLFLVGIGIVMVYSASSALALKKYGTDYFFLKKQATFALMGIVVLMVCRHFPHRFLRSLTYPFLIVATGLLFAIKYTKFGYAAGGSARWIHLGVISFQPSECARIALVIYLAYSLDKKKDTIEDFYVGFLPHMLVLGVLIVPIAIQPDFGSAFILGAITWIMLFVGRVRLLHLVAASTAALPVVYFFIVNAEYRFKRLVSFLNPWKYPTDEGYQIVHSLMAFGTGGIWGTGIGSGYQKLFYLPEPHTDFIFSVIGEELGLIGVLFTLGLYTLILWRGLWIARNAQDSFGSLLALGLTIAISLQVCVNMGVTLGLLPTKGLALPFLSYGGTSLLVNMACIGILMNIGAHRIEPN
jgi:cell division protein FtsW